MIGNLIGLWRRGKSEGQGGGATQAALIAHTYFKLRRWLGILAIVFPFGLYGIQRLTHEGPLPSSVSGYYHTGLKPIWIAALAVIAVFLYFYKGYDDVENLLLNLAGIGVLGVIFFPAAPDAGSLEGSTGFPWPPAHGISALVAFVSMGVVAVVLASRTLKLLDEGRIRDTLRITYWVLGGLMVILPVSVTVVMLVNDREDRVFWAELFAVVIFGIYWCVKTWEFSRTKADERAIQGTLPADLQNRTTRVVSQGAGVRNPSSDHGPGVAGPDPQTAP